MPGKKHKLPAAGLIPLGRVHTQHHTSQRAVYKSYIKKSFRRLCAKTRSDAFIHVANPKLHDAIVAK